jgi:hypothetical protein
MTYTLRSTDRGDGTTINNLVRDSDGAFIPEDPANTDYLQYLEWLEGGGVPTPELVAAPVDESAPIRSEAVAKLIALGLTEAEALAIAGMR